MTSAAVAIVLALAASTAAAAPPAVQDTIAQRMRACAVCHGEQGKATDAGYFPRIAGKPAGYLFNQLVNFRDGRRHNPEMVYLVELMTDDYLREIAGYFASLELPYPPAQPPAAASEPLMRRGAQLALHGDPARGIPACASCHGERLMGVEPAMPGLLGLSRDYLISQLGAWRVNTRAAAPPDCMADVANRLDPGDVSAVTSWLAAQTPPPGAKPQSRVPLPLPLECGSGLR
ncbi:MAG TPA: cytochrome c4 [Burkholderiaceae bacterium]|nr:cytochrome c4 [Burkholderiaceae bacterium]